MACALLQSPFAFELWAASPPLPELWLQDQVRELEKIELGLDQGVFESIQLEIIKREVAGLKEAAGNIVPADDFQKNLVQIRNSRLSEVSKRLGV